MVESISNRSEDTDMLNPAKWPSDEVRALFIPSEVRAHPEFFLNFL